MFNTISFNSGLLNKIQSIENLNVSDLQINFLTGEEIDLNFKSFHFFYTPSAENNFSFFCEYNPPAGEINFSFPDSPCSEFGSFNAYSGASGTITEILISDWTSYNYEGDTLSVDLSFYRLIIPDVIATGEFAESSLITSKIFTPIGYAGENALLDSLFIPISQALSLNFYSGENNLVSIENNVCFYPEFDAGEIGHLYHDYIGIVPSSTFSFYGAASYSQTSTCLTMSSLNSSAANAGINAFFETSFQFENDSDITFYFKRTKATAWYDDDLTDAGLWFCFFPNYAANEITFANWTWGYGVPYYLPLKGAIIFKMRWYNNYGVRVCYIDINGIERTNDLTVISNWTANEVNGTDECSIVLRGSSSNSVIQVRGKDKVVRQSGTFSNMANPFANGRSETKDTFLIHYHNYLVFTEKLCDMRIGSQEGFVLLPFVFMDSPSYSGENALIDNLKTSSLFYLNHYSGELAKVLLDIHQSIPLDIVPALTGETADTALIPFLFFRDLDIYQGQLGTASLTTVPPIVFALPAYSDETAYSDLSTIQSLVSSAYDGKTALFLLDTHPTIDLGSFSNYSGEVTPSFGLITSVILPVTSYSGANNLVALSTFVGVELSLPAYAGTLESLALATTSLLSGIAYSGQYGTASFTTFIGSTLVPIFYPGTYAAAALRTIDRLSPIGYSDEYATTSLTVFSAIPLSINSYSGEWSSASIQPGITFPSNACDGAYGTIDLTYTINPGLPAGWYDGECAQITISHTDALSFIGYAGENVLLYFGTSFALYPSAYNGQYSYSDLTLNPFDQLSGVGYSGQIVTSSLATITRLPNIGYAGEGILFDLYQNLQPSVALLAYSGDNAIASMQISFQLPVGRAYSGSNAVVNQIDNEPNTHFYADEALAIALSTTDAIKIPVLGTGENCFAALQVGKSEGLGTFRAYPGTELLTTFDTKHHVDLYVMFRTSVMTQVDIGSATYFDLNTDSCCGIRRESTSNNLMMHLFVKDYLPEAISDGDRVVFSVDLRCNPRLHVEFGTGQALVYREYDNYLSINFADGTESILNQFDADLTHKLCKGYFIPNGNWVVVEMNDVLPEDCYADVFYAGTTLSCSLSDDIVIRVSDNHWGESLIPSLTTFPPWLFIFYAGENLICSLYTLQATYPRAYTGEILQFRFYEEPFICYTGASGECELTIEYHVRFKEIGCLDNNFVFQNDSGDLVAELKNPVPVEGEPYYHSVLAECF